MATSQIKISDEDMNELREMASKPAEQLFDELNKKDAVPWTMDKVIFMKMNASVMLSNLEATGGIMTFHEQPPLGKVPDFIKDNS
jgi:hypothetical protein